MSTEFEQGAGTAPYKGIDYSVIVYGVLADVLLIVPILLYVLIPDTSAFAQYHQKYVNMVAAAYGPMAIIWLMVVADDSRVSREALTGSVELAGLGPFALLWVGYFSFIMTAQSSGQLSGAPALWVWCILYFVLNVLLIVAHWFLSPLVYEWIATSPLPNKKYVTADGTIKEINDAEVAEASTESAF